MDFRLWRAIWGTILWLVGGHLFGFNLMGKVTIYKYLIFDYERIVQMRRRGRWGTRDAIAGLEYARIVEGSGPEIDASVLDHDGFTAPDFEPI